jgi:hypothetical protein
MAFFDRFTKLLPKSEDKFKPDEEEQIKDDVVVLKNTDVPEADAFSISQLSWGIDFDVRAKTIYDLISMYRRATVNFEIEDAIDEITNEAIIKETGDVVDIDLDDVEGISDSIKKKVKDEFDEIIKLLNFNNEGDFLFRRWYTDGRLYFQVIVDPGDEKKGIKKLQILSPFDIIRIKIDDKTKQFAKEKDVELKGDFAYVYKISKRRLDGCANTRNLHLYQYNEEEEKGYLISDSMITFVPSGMTDWSGRIFISPLHKSLKPLNQLRLLEDSAVIYRITRAPERRVFFIDVGKLPKKKADAYVQKLIRGFKSKIYYDATTGQLSTKKNVLSMIQDYYLPTNSDQKGTKIETLEGGQQLGEIEDIVYFKKKLYKSLKVPIERIDDEENPVIDIGRTGDMPRKELKFTKYIKTLRYRFSTLFNDLLEKQLIYKNIMSKKEWREVRNQIQYIWQQDNYYAEIKETELMKDRLELATETEEFIGKYFSNLWVQKEIFKMTDDDIKEQQAQIKKEEAAGEIDDTPEDEFGDGSPEPKDDKQKQDPDMKQKQDEEDKKNGGKPEDKKEPPKKEEKPEDKNK